MTEPCYDRCQRGVPRHHLDRAADLFRCDECPGWTDYMRTKAAARTAVDVHLVCAAPSCRKVEATPLSPWENVVVSHHGEREAWACSVECAEEIARDGAWDGYPWGQVEL